MEDHTPPSNQINCNQVAVEVAEEIWLDLMNDFQGNSQPIQMKGLAHYSKTQEGICCVSAYDQFCSNICGFHALFNAIQLVQFITGDTTSLSKMNSAAEFWKFYYETKDYLLKEYPNKKEIDHINNLGALDRNHLEFYIAHSPIIETLKKECCIKKIELRLEPFYYGFGIVQHTEEQINNLQGIFDKFNSKNTNNSSNYISVMFTGTTNHWVVFVAHKQQAENIQPTYYFVDSQNLNFTDIITGNIQNLLQQIELRKAARGTKPAQQFHEFREKVMKTSLQDRKDVLLLLKKCFEGKLNLQVYAIEKQLKDFQQTFEDYFPQWNTPQDCNKQISEVSSQSSEDLRPEMMWMFIVREVPPQVLEHDILKNLRKNCDIVRQQISPDVAHTFISLLTFQLSILSILSANPCDKNPETLSKFSRGISELIEILSQVPTA